MYKCFCLAFINLLIAAQLHAQLKGKLVNHVGFMYEVIQSQTIPTSSLQGPVNYTFEYYTFRLGTYYTLLHTQNDQLSLGIDPSFQFGFNFPNTGSQVYFDHTIQIPVLLMGRLGALSSPYNVQRLGLGGGIGLKYTYFSKTLFDNSLRNIVRPKGDFINLVAAAEFTVSFQGQLLTFRGVFSLSDVENILDFTNFEETNAAFGGFGIGLLYRF